MTIPKRSLWAKELQPGLEFGEDFLIENLRIAETKHGKSYASCNLVDKTGSVTARLWDYNAGMHPEIKDGNIVHILGTSEDYKGNTQIRINATQPALSRDTSPFVKTSKYNIEKMWSQLIEIVGELGHANLKVVAEELLLNKDWAKLFKYNPAAKSVHHAFVGGLLEHTLEMCIIGKKIFELSFMSSNLNKDLCMFGLIFHDYGKIFEYKAEPGSGKTVHGQLVGHIPQTAAMIYHFCREHDVPSDERDHMMHVVLAHHGQVAWGSPVVPATPEAWFVHFIDNMHSTVFRATQTIEDHAKPGDEMVRHPIIRDYYVTKRFNDLISTTVSSRLAVEEGF